jgi:hypothetical protein
MPRVEKKAVNKQPAKKNQVNQKKQVDAKIIKIGAVIGLLAILGVLAYLLLDKYVFTEKEPNYNRFETLEHLTLDEYKYLIGTNEDQDDAITDVFHDIYIFVYNGNYDECTTCEDLEEIVKDAASKAKEKGYSFFVLNYNEYNEIQTEVSGLQLPSRPGLIHIEGEAIATTEGVLTVQTQIEYKLATISK